MLNIYLLFGLLFIVGYILIATEHKTHINKSGIAIVLGASLWLIIAIISPDKVKVSHAIAENGSEIFQIVIFLLAAMTIVEILVFFKFFDWIREQITKREMSSTKLFWVLGFLTFIISAFLDNLTTTLIMIQIGRKIYKNEKIFLIYVANTIIAANAGGAASPIGDVTTIMLWLSGKYNAIEILRDGTIPALVTWVIPQYLLTYKIRNIIFVRKINEIYEEKAKPNWVIIFLALSSFILPIIFNLVGLPPFIGLLLGLGIIWTFVDMKAKNGNDDYKMGKVVNMIKNVDIVTLKFFIGILLAVGALSYVGLLTATNDLIFGNEVNEIRIIIGNTFLGLLSSVVDNVPLVAAAIKMFPAEVTPDLWVLLALTAGTGGSIFVIGSAAGVAAMGQVEELVNKGELTQKLSFAYYMKVASIPALLGFMGGITTWLLLAY